MHQAKLRHVLSPAFLYQAADVVFSGYSRYRIYLSTLDDYLCHHIYRTVSGQSLGFLVEPYCCAEVLPECIPLRRSTRRLGFCC